MANPVVEYILRLRDEASAALRGTSAEAGKTANALDEAADEALDAERKLDALGDTAERTGDRFEEFSRKADRLAEKAERAGEAAERGSRGTKKASDRTRLLAETAGDADSVLLGFAGALGRVSPEAEQVAIVLGDVAAGTEAILRSGARVARVLGPVAVAVLALGAAWAKLKKDLDAATAAQERAAKAAVAAQDMHERAADVALEAALARGELTRAAFDSEVAERKAERAYRDTTNTLREEQRQIGLSIEKKRQEISAREEAGRKSKELAEAALELARAQDKATDSAQAHTRLVEENSDVVGSAAESMRQLSGDTRAASDAIGPLTRVAMRDLTESTSGTTVALRTMSEEVEALEKKSESLGTQIEVASGQRKSLAADLKSISGAARNASPAVTAAADSVDALAEALDHMREAEEGEETPGLKLKDRTLALKDEIDKLADSLGLGLTQMDRLRLTEIDLDLAFQQGRLTLEDYHAALKIVHEAQQRLGEQPAPEALVTGGRAGAQGSVSVTGLAGAASQGDVSGLLSSFSDIPILGIIAGILEVLVSIGEQGSDKIVDNLGEFQDNLLASFRELPELIPKFIAETTSEFIPELAKAIGEQAPEIVKALTASGWDLTAFGIKLPFLFAQGLIEGLAEWWNSIEPGWWKNLNLKEGFAESFGTDGEFTARDVGRALSPALHAVGEALGFAEGGYVSRTGLAIVHQGERVVAKGGAVTGSARRNLALGQGGIPAINISTMVLDRDAIPALVRQIERKYGAYGIASSPLLG